jgi:hypothetical protein
MKSATTPILVGRATGGALVKNSAAYKNIKDANVTGFSTSLMAGLAFLGSVLFSVAMIAVDGAMIAIVSGSNSTLATHEDHKMNKSRFFTTIYVLLAFDIVVLVTQAIDLFFFHFRLWVLTAITWTGQFFGVALSAAMISATMLASEALEADTGVLFNLSIASAFMHALFTASQFSVTIEYLMRKV